MKFIKQISAITLLIYVLFSCREDNLTSDIPLVEEEEEIIDSLTYTDWTSETHSQDADPNYDIVFKQNSVLRLDIEISSANWSAMQSDLSSIYRGNSSSSENPIWVECSLFYDDIEWYHVGVRYKGNSSLQSAYQSGNNKLSFKLDFDEFEDDYTGIQNQRFYGFKQLNLNNNYDDSSLMREKVGADLFRAFGLAAANTSFCEVYVDHGSGSQYFGLYTIVEEVDDTVLETQFADGSGNLYKPDGDAASFGNGTFDTSEMELKTNEDIADYSDVESLYSVINSSLRESDSESWKSELESIFNVPQFLKWLAANTVIQNWDTYGNMTHNYYIYNNPQDSLITWIPWDNNEAFQYGKSPGALSLDLNSVSSNWPLISYIIDEDEYRAEYDQYLREFTDSVFIEADMEALYTSYYELLKESAYNEESGYTYIGSDYYFDSAVETLKSHVTSRNSAVDSYLGE